jgi:hypothetical protein
MNDTCIVLMKDETSFEWDKLYVFNLPLPQEEVDKVIGMSYSYYEEFTRPMIFVKDGNIVYHENNRTNIEGIVDNQVIFGGILDTTRYRTFSIDEAVFRARKKKSGSKNYYELITIDR